ncbi:MAG TPA: hypothetical protein VI959_04365 [Alphaproteobacteria bacterium]|nr:hypothetical protein [Alphaproteobacteria bacterium]
MKLFKKVLFIGFGCVLPWVLSASYYHLISGTDLSMKPVAFKGEKGPHVALVTYADGLEQFHQNRNTLAYTAIDRGFDFTFNYQRSHIDEEFLKKNPILNEKPGVGFWLWKPYFILKALDRLQDGEYLLYADSGFLLRDGFRDFVINMMTESKKDIALFAYAPKDHGTAVSCASADVFKALKCEGEACQKSPHVMGGLVFIKNTPTTRAFIKQWLDYCCDADLLTGRNQKEPALHGHSHHQHDEGILSVLAGRENNLIVYVPADQEFFKHIRMHRRKANTESLWPYTSDALYREEKYFLQLLLPKVVTDFFIKNSNSK